MTRTILVVGGGPAGSVTATFLAKEGFTVRLIESRHFPRYHIGESLTPSTRGILDLVGVADRVDRAGFQPKRGGVFVWGEDTWVIDWGEIFGSTVTTWQVDRARFDALLLDNARDHGVAVEFGMGARSVTFGPDGRPSAVSGRRDDGTGFTIDDFDFLVDASGRYGLLSAHHLRNRRPNAFFRNVAIWGYWDGAHALPECPEGGINVVSSPRGWYWVIPLGGGRSSVGMVTRKEAFAADRRGHAGLDAVYHAYLRESETVRGLLADAEFHGPVRVETDYSYVADTFSGPGYVLVGDAACFLDPLLSSGIHFALYGGMVAAAAVTSAYRGDVTEQEGLRFYDTAYRRAYTRMLALVGDMYERYRGRDEFFWTADRLVGEPGAAGQRGERAFGEIIGGLTDVREVTRPETRVAGARIEQEARRVRSGESLLGVRRDLGAASPIDGLLLRTRPGLGLERVSAD